MSKVHHTETSKATTPETCSKCDEDFAGVKVTDTDERQKIDILFEVVTHRVIAKVKICPNCGKSNKGSFPEGMDGKAQYGDTVKAMVINFICVQMMSLQRLQEHMMSIMGRYLSQAIDDVDIIPKYTGTLIHNCWASYLSYDNAGHALCGAHILRELKYTEEADGYSWATKLKTILQDALEVVNSRPGKRTLTKQEYIILQSRYRNTLSHVPVTRYCCSSHRPGIFFMTVRMGRTLALGA